MAAETTDCLDDLQSIADKLTNIARLSAEYHLRLSAALCSASSCNVPGTLCACLTHDMDQRLWVFEHYATSFTNTLVCGIFDKLVKSNKYVAVDDVVFYDDCYAVIAIAIRLQSDYDVSRTPASIRRDSTRAKNEHVSFRRSRIAVESSANRNFETASPSSLSCSEGQRLLDVVLMNSCIGRAMKTAPAYFFFINAICNCYYYFYMPLGVIIPRAKNN